MSEILVLVDHGDGRPRTAALQLLTAARSVAATTGDAVAAVWLGPGAAGAAEVLGRHGAERVLAWESADAKAFVTLPQVDALDQLVAAGKLGRLAAGAGGEGVASGVHGAILSFPDNVGKLFMRMNAG